MARELFDTDLSELVKKLYNSGSCESHDESNRAFKNKILCALNIVKINGNGKSEKRVLILRESGIYIYQKSWTKSLKDYRCALWFNVSSITVNGSHLTVLCKGQAKDKTVIEEQRVPSITQLIHRHLADILTQRQLDGVFGEGVVRAVDSNNKPLRALSRFRARFFGNRSDGSFPVSISGTYAASLISKTESINITDYKLVGDEWLCNGKDWVPEFVDSFQLIPWLTHVSFPLNETKHLHWDCACELLTTTTTIKYFATGEDFEKRDFDMFCHKIPLMSDVVKEIGFLRGGEAIRGQQLATLVEAMAKKGMSGLSFSSAVIPARIKMIQEGMLNSSIIKLAISHQTEAGNLMRILTSMSGLRSLSLTHSELEVSGFLKMACAMPAIEELDLSGNWIQASGSSTVHDMRNLRVLKVDGLPLEHMGGIVRSVMTSRHMEVFSMCSATGTEEIANSVFAFLGDGRKRKLNTVLKELYMNRCVVTLAVFVYIHQFASLAVLALDGALGQPGVIANLAEHISSYRRGLESLSLCGSFERAVSGDDVIKMFPVLESHNTLVKLDISHTGLGKETHPVRGVEESQTIAKAPESAVAPTARVDLLVAFLKKNIGIALLGVNGCWNKDASLIDRFVDGLSDRSTSLDILMPKSDIEQMLQIGSIDSVWVDSLYGRLEKLRMKSKCPSDRYRTDSIVVVDDNEFITTAPPSFISKFASLHPYVKSKGQEAFSTLPGEWDFDIDVVGEPESKEERNELDRYFVQNVYPALKQYGASTEH